MSKNRYLAEVQALYEWVERCRVMDDPLYIVDKLVPAEGLTLISGAPKRAYKTWFTKSLCLAAASGKPVGPFVPTNPEGVPTLLISQEGGAKASAGRFDKIQNGMDVTLSEIDKFHILHRTDFFLDTPSDVEDMLDLCRHLDIQLLALDPFSKLFKGDENSSQPVGAALRAIGEFNREGIGVILTHHLNKGGKDGVGGDIDDHLRGSSALAGAYDGHLALRHTKGRWIKLYTRFKDDEEKAWRIIWTISTEDNFARAEMVEADEEAEESQQVSHCLEVMRPDAEYTKRELGQLWGTENAETANIILALKNQNVIERSGTNQWRKTL